MTTTNRTGGRMSYIYELYDTPDKVIRTMGHANTINSIVAERARDRLRLEVDSPWGWNWLHPEVSNDGWEVMFEDINALHDDDSTPIIKLTWEEFYMSEDEWWRYIKKGAKT